MLSEAKIILPKLDNESNDLGVEREIILTRILDAFGGYNIAPSSGAWKNPNTGIVYHDEVFTVTVASDWTVYREAERFELLAEWACRLCRQESIYISIDGKTSFVDDSKYDIAA